MKKVVIIGAGASGLITAIYAKRNGNDVILIEKRNMWKKNFSNQEMEDVIIGIKTNL